MPEAVIPSMGWPGLLAPVVVVLLALLVAGVAWLLAHRPADPATAVQEALARQAAAHDSALRALREEAAAQARQDLSLIHISEPTRPY